MEPILDVFSSDAFSFVTLTDSINKLPFVPGRLGALGLFTEAPVPTTSIALEEQAGILTLVNPTPRGGPGETRPKPLRRARVLKVPHYQLDDNVLAEEVQNVREFGPQMQPRSVETYLSGRMEMFTAQLDVTTEFQRVGAIKGLIVDRDGNTIYDLFSEFGVTAVTPINFALSNANTAVRKKCSQLVRTMSQTLGGVAFTSVYGLCGDTFWDDLIDHRGSPRHLPLPGGRAPARGRGVLDPQIRRHHLRELSRLDRRRHRCGRHRHPVHRSERGAFLPAGDAQPVQDVLCAGRLYRDGQYAGPAALRQGDSLRQQQVRPPGDADQSALALSAAARPDQGPAPLMGSSEHS